MDNARRVELTGLLTQLGLSIPEDPTLLDLALTHRSWSVEHQDAEDNERLEFMGDAVISLVTTEYLYQQRPSDEEGTLSKLRAAMVSRRILGEVAADLGLGSMIKLGAGENASGGRLRHSILGSALEAVCAALYHLYEWEDLRRALRKHVVEPALAMAENEVVADYKSRLQEWTQKSLKSVPEYRVRESHGPDHDREFVVEVLVEGEPMAKGRGSRIKLAENDAAREALGRIAKSESNELTD